MQVEEVEDARGGGGGSWSRWSWWIRWSRWMEVLVLESCSRNSRKLTQEEVVEVEVVQSMVLQVVEEMLWFRYSYC
jgi:hypothetical protein